ncbi:hypothetical protein SETIT_9G529700v2 [Setaria italica]|uniref:Pectin acetylesterase n=2 Tax=Setaria TaxID=4554 RepID=A0A368SVI6_SETIT|nr:hypothetical protein SETIT_9G529700v2 [Setaria italica]TKV98040.1 hypothetical protein SEVIR_9G534200v2 [Setaria viridis]
MARAVVVVAVLLMQCCNVILAARPLLHAAAGDGRGWKLWHGGEALIMQALKGPGGGNCHFVDPSHPPCASAAAIAVTPQLPTHT